MTTETHKKLILQHLESGHTITTAKAYRLFKCLSLAARVKNLRDEGYPIRSEPVKHKKGWHAEYSLVKD